MVYGRKQAVRDKYVREGWGVCSRGGPDFLLVKTDAVGDIVEDGVVMVKPLKGALSYEQLVFIKFLRRHGVTVHVEVLEGRFRTI